LTVELPSDKSFFGLHPIIATESCLSSILFPWLIIVVRLPGLAFVSHGSTPGTPTPPASINAFRTHFSLRRVVHEKPALISLCPHPGVGLCFRLCLERCIARSGNGSPLQNISLHCIEPGDKERWYQFMIMRTICGAGCRDAPCKMQL
jgi:hypothetical protein